MIDNHGAEGDWHVHRGMREKETRKSLVKLIYNPIRSKLISKS